MTTVIIAAAAPGYKTDDPRVGGYLASYSPERCCVHPSHNPFDREEPTWTPRLADAMQFLDSRAAFDAWTAVATCHPVRDDGKPNKPLTAWTVSMETL